MSTACYAQVRGAAVRATALGRKGEPTSPVRYVASKSITRVRINEVVDRGDNTVEKTPDNAKRIRLQRPDTLIRYTVDIEFLRVDPALLEMITGVRPVYGVSPIAGVGGFGIGAFGEMPFGDTSGTPGEQAVKGFDATSRDAITSFGLEVWTKLAGNHCAPDGQRQWGYTLFPYLRGGRISGFRVSNGLASFNLIGAQARRRSRWGVGPHDLTGDFERLLSPVSGNLAFRNYITTAAPPDQTDGVVQFDDVVNNGNAANPMPIPDAPLVLNGGNASTTSPWIIDGGRA